MQVLSGHSCDPALLGLVTAAVTATKKMKPYRESLPPAQLRKLVRSDLACHDLAVERPHHKPPPGKVSIVPVLPPTPFAGTQGGYTL